ncbi:MAG: hypothetical protein M1829_003103 [Trizodia sp. TS-e1964]|nr:MAG: hypothetical protein M1829_003103 [Trizodia sp. TS-e1964]
MATRRPHLSVPTSAPLPDSTRLSPSNPVAIKTLLKLTRPSLIDLVFRWLDDEHQPNCAPYLAEDEADSEDDDEIYPPCQNLEDLRDVYQQLQSRKGSKREVIDRIIEGDWRGGLSLYQLATADMQHLLDHLNAQKWVAMKLVKVAKDRSGEHSGDISPYEENEEANRLPRFHAPSFLRNLQAEISPIVKAHFYLTRPKALQLLLLRIHVIDTPYLSQQSVGESMRYKSSESSRTIYIAFPDGAPAMYISLATASGQPSGGEGRSLRKLIIDALPKALSRPRARYKLETSSLVLRSLPTLLALRGTGRSVSMAGGWSAFANNNVDPNPLEYAPRNFDRLHGVESQPTPEPSAREANPDDIGERVSKRRKLVAEARFGDCESTAAANGIERLDIRMEDPFIGPLLDGEPNANPDHEQESTRMPPLDPNIDQNEDQSWAPDIRLTFYGTNIFAGMKHLVEMGTIDGEKIPGWMTGENGVSIGVVKHGRILGSSGSGV